MVWVRYTIFLLRLFLAKPKRKYSHRLTTLVCEINMPAGISVPPGEFSKDNKHLPGKFN